MLKFFFSYHVRKIPGLETTVGITASCTANRDLTRNKIYALKRPQLTINGTRLFVLLSRSGMLKFFFSYHVRKIPGFLVGEEVKVRVFRSYCLCMYGTALWNTYTVNCMKKTEKLLSQMYQVVLWL